MAGRDAGPGGAAAASEPGVPPSVLRSWDEAEARLFPLVMAQPELYQQALGAIQRLLGRLRETCPDLPALLAAHERGGDLLRRRRGAEVPGIRPGLIAAAACAMRYRELVARLAAAAPAGGAGPGARAGPALDGGGGERPGRTRALRALPAGRSGTRDRTRRDRLDRARRDAEPGRVPPGRGPDRPDLRRPADRRPARQLPRPRRVRRRPAPDPGRTPPSPRARPRWPGPTLSGEQAPRPDVAVLLSRCRGGHVSAPPPSAS